MSNREHWTLRLFAVLVIGLCTIRCGGTQETLIVVAPANWHTLQTVEPASAESPRPIAAHETIPKDILNGVPGCPECVRLEWAEP